VSAPAEAGRARPRFLPVRWLLSPAADLAFMIGSVGISYLLLFLWSSGRLSLTSLVLLWIFAFHGPHFYGTMSRTYLDPTEWKERGPVLLRAFGWFLVGPLMVGAGLLVQRYTGYGDVVLLFFFLAALWAFQHVVKQHFGFVALYRSKHEQFDKEGFTFLKWYLIVSHWAPVALVLLSTVSWFQQIPLAMVLAERAGEQRAVEVTGLLGDVFLACFWAAQAALAVWLGRELWKGRGLNLPVLLILLASVPLNYFVAKACLAASLAGPPGNLEAYAFVPLVTSYHNVQYHALIWHYNRHKYGGRSKEHGLASWANRSLPVYLACGLAYTLVTIGIEYYPSSIYDVSGAARGTYGGEILAAGIWGFSFLHYYLDGHIWHVRSDANLRRVLGFPDPSTKPDSTREASTAGAPRPTPG
jgi:hypothetical protein